MTTQPPPWNSNVPLEKDFIAGSQEDFLNNFQRLYEAFARDHIPLDAPLNAGNHTVVHLKEMKMGANTSTSEIAMYTKRVNDQTDQLFIRNQGNGVEVQYTNWQIYEVQPNTVPGPGGTPAIVQTRYFTFLPGGSIVYFGLIFPGFDNFPLFLDPPICRNIVSINFSVVGSTRLYPSNPTIIASPDGRISTITLSSSHSQPIPPIQYYVIVGDSI